MNPTYIYLAASWSRKQDMADARDYALRTYGQHRIAIVSTWMDETHTLHSSQGAYTPGYLQEIAVQDTAELDAADVLVLFAEDPTIPKIGGGKHWEFGYAYAKQKTCIIVGPQEHVFYHMPGVFHVDTFDEALALIIGAQHANPDTRTMVSYITRRA